MDRAATVIGIYPSDSNVARTFIIEGAGNTAGTITFNNHGELYLGKGHNSSIIFTSGLNVNMSLAASTNSSLGFFPQLAAGTLSFAGDINLTGPGKLRLNGVTNENFPGSPNYSLTGTDTTTIEFLDGSTVSWLGTLNLDTNCSMTTTNTATETVGTVISGNGSVDWGITAANTVSLTGTNTYSGGTTISTGILELSGAGALSNTGSVAIAAGATFSIGNIAAGTTTIGNLSGSGNVTLGSNKTLVYGTATATQTFSGVISGTGGITKQGTGTSILSGDNTYGGTTTISAGEFEFKGSTAGLTGTITNNALLSFTQTLDSSFNQVISGTGELIKDDVSTLTLTAANDYTGETIIRETGSIALTGVGSISSSSVLIIANGRFDISGITPASTTILDLRGNVGTTISLGAKTLVYGTATETDTFSGVISGTGGITKQGTGTSILTGNNTYSGGTTITGGTLRGNSSSLQGDIAVGTNILTFNQTATGTYAGVITGAAGATVNKTGGGALILSGNSPAYGGDLSVTAGILQVNGTIAGTMSVTANGTLQGTGTVGATTNAAVVDPGNSIGTLNIVGNYIQTGAGNLVTELNAAGQSDLLEITGTATLAGSVIPRPEPGIYTINTTYRILRAAGGLGGTTFDNIIDNSALNFILEYNGDSAFLRITASAAVLPVPLSDLTGNARRVADYVFCDVGEDPNLLSLQIQLAALSAQNFPIDLVELCPAIYGSLALSGFQNNIHMAGVMTQHVKNLFCNCTPPAASNSGLTFWVDPIGFLYKQKGIQDQIGFDLYSYGAATGFSSQTSESSIFSLAAGYTHSNLFWREDAGDAEADSVYCAPSIGFSNGTAYFNFLIQGSIDFYNVKRHIQFATIDTNAKNHHKSYNTLCRIDIGAKLKAGEHKGVYIQPEISFNYVNLFEERYSEKGASNFINLTVRQKLSVFLQPNGGLKIIKEFEHKNFCFGPSIYVGWLGNIPMTSGTYTSSLYQLNIPCENKFGVISYHEIANQLSLSAECLVRKCDDSLFTVGYRADILSHIQIHAVYLRYNWDF